MQMGAPASYPMDFVQCPVQLCHEIFFAILLPGSTQLFLLQLTREQLVRRSHC